jgi:hypoxanthine phosphoribosyltransferase
MSRQGSGVPPGYAAADMAEVLLSSEQVQARVRELGAEISRDYVGRDLLLVAVLKGSAFLIADLLRAIEIPVAVEFIAISSYGPATQSSGVVRFLKDLDTSIEGRDVLVVEDIVDTGLTLNYILKVLRGRRPGSLHVGTLLNKPARRLIDIPLRYRGFDLPDQFVVGYGLDLGGKYRNLSYIGVLRPEVLDA